MTYFTDSEELRQLGRLFGITDPNAGHEVIGDEITSRFETLRHALTIAREYMRHSLGSRYEGPDPYPIIDAALSKVAPDFPPQGARPEEDAT